MQTSIDPIDPTDPTATQFATTPTPRIVHLIGRYRTLLAEPQTDQARLVFRRTLAELQLELARRESALATAS